MSVACREHNVQWLVYTSTYNVVFAGQVIENGDDSTPYSPLDQVNSLITSGSGSPFLAACGSLLTYKVCGRADGDSSQWRSVTRW